MGLSLLVIAGCGADEQEEQAEEAKEKPFYLTLDPPPAPELSPEEALKSFALAPGFEIELAASEPLIVDPVAIAWDEDGRLYAAEMRGFMPDTYGTGQTDPVGMVVRLTDEDGDGRFDAREVVADKLVLPRALAIVREGLLIGEPPNLWLCPKGDSGDVDCSARRNLGSYGDQPGSVEHAENGLLAGLDNWLYSAKSDRRLKLGAGGLVEEKTLFRGQWGISQDDDGHLYYNTNSNLLSGDFYPADGVVAAGSTAATGLNEQILIDDEVFSIRVNPGVNRAYVPGVLREDGRLRRPTSASGMTTYRGHQFPASYLRDVFVTEPAANAIAHLRLTRDGLAISAEHLLYDDAQWGQREFLASTDERFRPVDVQVGPDGALYVVDMYRGIIQDHVFITEELRAQIQERGLDKPLGLGRIWRISHEASEDSTGSPELSRANADELIALLGHTNAWHRETAQRLLVGVANDGLTGQLEAVVREDELPAAVQALWTLHGRGELTAELVAEALATGQDAVARHVLRAAEGLLTAEALVQLADDLPRRDVAFTQQFIFSLGAHNDATAVKALLVTLTDSVWSEPLQLAALQASMRGTETEAIEALQQSHWDSERESNSGFLRAIAHQAMRNVPEQMTALLDWLLTQPAEARWLTEAVLAGLSDAAKDEGFERLVLPVAHPLLTTDDEALWAVVADARRVFTWPGDELLADAKPLSPGQRAAMEQGGEFYVSSCANCHGPAGAGIVGLGPVLAGSPWVTEATERLARIVLQGLSGPIEVDGEIWDSVMPGHGAHPEFGDEIAAGLLTFLHRSWGHGARAVSADFVRAVRAETEGRTAPWTVAELQEIPINTHYDRYAGRFGAPGFELAFAYDGERELLISSAIFNGPLVEEAEDRFFYPDRELHLEFLPGEDGRAVAVRIPDGGDGRMLPRMTD